MTWNGEDAGNSPRKMFVLDVESIPATCVFYLPPFSQLISKARANIKTYSEQMHWDDITQF